MHAHVVPLVVEAQATQGVLGRMDAMSHTHCCRHAYALDVHLKRLENSAHRARMPLPHSRPALKDLILDLIAASGEADGQSRSVVIWNEHERF